jgi:hypothetical protein
MQANKKEVQCGNVVAKPSDLINLAKTQVIIYIKIVEILLQF